jgi:hypothetical protein
LLFWSENPDKCATSSVARLAQGGALIGIFGHFSPNRSKDLVNEPSELASEVTSTIKRNQGLRPPVCGKAPPFRGAETLVGYAQPLRQQEAQPQIVFGPDGKAQPFRAPSAASRFWSRVVNTKVVPRLVTPGEHKVVPHFGATGEHKGGDALRSRYQRATGRAVPRHYYCFCCIFRWQIARYA